MNNVLFRLVGGELLQFAVFENELPQGFNETSITTNVKFFYNGNIRVLKCVTEGLYSHKEKTFAKISNAMYFEIAEKTVKNLSIDKKISVPQEILSYFASLTYGSLRGMCTLKGDEFKVPLPILPPVNFNEIIKEASIFDIES